MDAEQTEHTEKRSALPGALAEGRRAPDAPRRRAEDYFWRYVPHGMLRALGGEHITDIDVGRHAEHKVTVLFMDIRNFSTLSERLAAAEIFDLLNRVFGMAVPIIHDHGGMIDKFIGDAIMAVFTGAPDGAVAAAAAVMRELPELELPASVSEPIAMGAGLNRGFAIIGAVGDHERMDVTVIGDAVNLASRLEGLNKRYGSRCLVSETVASGLEDPERFAMRMVDRIRVKGKLRPQSVYEILDAFSPQQRSRLAAGVADFENMLAHYHLGRIDSAHALVDKVRADHPDDHVAAFYAQRCRDFERDGTFEGLGEAEQHVPWLPAYSIGVPVVDAQHQRLLEAANDLCDSIRAEDASRLTSILDFLQSYASEHFRTEERVMARHGYPFMAEHLHEHRRFVDYFSHVRREIEAGSHDRLYLLFEIDVFLVDWLLTHTTGVDRHLGSWLLAEGHEVPA